MLGLLLAMTTALLAPKVHPLPASPVTPRSLHPCPLDATGLRDLFARADEAALDPRRARLRQVQIQRLRRLARHTKGYGGRVAWALGERLLEGAEQARAAGRDPGPAGESARRFLQAAFEQAPEYERMDEVVAGLGHAALLRCDPEDALRWFAIYARRYPDGRDRARVLTVLARLEAGDGAAAAAALDAARNAPEPIEPTYETPEPKVVVDAGDPWVARSAQACALDAYGVRDLWTRMDAVRPEDDRDRVRLRRRQIRQLDKILQSTVGQKSRVGSRIGRIYLEQGEMHRARGSDPSVAGEHARRSLRWVYTHYPNSSRLDGVVAGLGHAALLRCDPQTARAWFAMHVERFPKASDRERVLAVLAVLEVQDAP